MGFCCFPFNLATCVGSAVAVALLYGLRRVDDYWFIGLVVAPAVLYALLAEKTKRTRIAGAKVLVTGASSGLGKAMSIEAAKRGASMLILVARSEGKLKETATECEQASKAAGHSSIQVVIETCDLMDKEDIKRLTSKVTAEQGAVDLLVNNAGAGAWKHIEETTPEDAIEMMACPVMSSIMMTALLVPVMAKAKTGHILNVTSAAGSVAFRGAVVYSAARWAIRGFSKNLYWDLKQLGIGVTLLSPAEIEGTDYFKNAPGKAGGDSHERIPLLFSIFGPLGLNYSTSTTAWSALNAVENGWSIANTPMHLTHLTVLANQIIPFFLESACNVGGRGIRKQGSQQETGVALTSAAAASS